MKVLRSILYVVIAILLGLLINVLSLTMILKNVVQEEIITNTIKASLTSGYLAKNMDNLTEDQKKMLEKFLNDEDINEVVDVLVDNYTNYQSNENYKISQSDVDKLKKYIDDHQDFIKEISDEDINIEDIKKEITVDNIDKNAKKAIEKLDELPEEIKPVVTSYKYITLGPVKLVLIALIVVCIALMILISWSLIKWMKSTGICLITNGVLISLLYLFIDAAKSMVMRVINNNTLFNNISFNNILIIGLSELIIGIILIVVYKLLNKKTNKEEKIDNNNEQKKELPAEENKEETNN